ncbi:lamin tail domain-containing protein [Streptomyces sp. NPDC002285]
MERPSLADQSLSLVEGEISVSRIGGIAMAVVMAASATGLAMMSPIAAFADTDERFTDLVISEVYGGGGNSGALYKADFIDLYNRGNGYISLDGYSVQYAPAGSSTWQTTALSGHIAPGGHYLVKEAIGTVGSDLGVPDASGSINLNATAGKVAVVENSTALTCATGCATAAGVLDFVGYGTTASSFEGSPAPAPSNTTSINRNNSGTDTENNASDFALAAPTPGGRTPGVGCGEQQLLANPGFEGGSAPWADAADAFLITNSGPAPAHSGSYRASFHEAPDYEAGIRQQVTIPSHCKTATLSFWLDVATDEHDPDTLDGFYVNVIGGGGAWLEPVTGFKAHQATAGYVQHSFDLSKYIGQTVTLQIHAYEDDDQATTFNLDDLALTTS